MRNPFSVEEMTLEFPTDMVIYRSRLNAKINRNFEVFTATDFLAAITQHIPDKGAQMVRYYGWYSNKMRGVRHRRRALHVRTLWRRGPNPGLRECANRLRPILVQAGRPESGTGLLWPGLPRTAVLLTHCLAARPLPPAYALGDGAKPPETRQ